MSKRSTQPEVPELSSFPDYAKVAAKREEIHERLNATERAIDEYLSRPPVKLPPSATRVAALLGDEPPIEGEVQEDYATMRRELSALKEATHQIEKRCQEVRCKRSAQICQPLQPYHDQLVREICAALVSLHEANAQYQRFADELNAKQIAWAGHLRPMHCSFARSPLVAHYLNEAVEHGFFDPANVPDALRF